MIKLEGVKVILKTLEREHCEKLWQEYEPELPISTEPLNPGLSIEGAARWFETIQNEQGRSQIYLGIFTQLGDLVGDIQLAHIDWRNRSASLGISLTKKKHRGCGYGTDAINALVKFAFKELDLYRISARTLVHNKAARRVLENTGFTLEGTEREAVYISGRRWDRLFFGLLRNEIG
jgi:RimJ/RimL family protein N-acetyltransferase